MSRKTGGATVPTVEGKKPSEASVIIKGTRKVQFEGNGKLKIPVKPEAVPVDCSVSEDQKVKVGGLDLNGKKKERKTTKKPKNDNSKTQALHREFVELAIKEIPGCKEEPVKGEIFTVITKDGNVLTTIRDRIHPLRVASHKYLDGKSVQLETEKQMLDFIGRVHKAYETKTKETEAPKTGKGQ